jgi:D-galactarolactone cycloisomerase
MVIDDISFVPLQALFPAGSAYGMSKSLATARATTLVRLRLADGTEGIGECWGLPQVNLAVLPLVKSYVVGTNVLDIEHTYSQMLARHYHFGVQGPMTWCISGIDMAAKDAAGKKLGLPVHRLIGGKQAGHVPIYASGGY